MVVLPVRSVLLGALLAVACDGPSVDSTALEEAAPYAEAMYLALTDTGVVFAGPTSVTQVRYCAQTGAVADCGAGKGVAAQALVTTASRAYFKAPAEVPLAHEQKMAVVGLDASGNTVASSVVKSLDQQAPSTALPAEKNVDLSGKGGAKSKLAEHFKGKYLMIDLSGAQCGGCIQLAGMIQRDRELQQIFSSGKCSHVTVVDDLGGWSQQVGQAAAEHSFESAAGLHGVARAFGITLRFTPTVFLIDPSGKVVSDADARIPDELKRNCT